jgi:hypothetical protein
MKNPSFHLDQPVEGQPLVVGRWTLRPRARVRARGLALPGASGWTARLIPEAVEVAAEDGATTTLQLPGAVDRVGGMLVAAGLVAVGSALVAFVARRGVGRPGQT